MSKLIKPSIGFTTIPNYIINDKRLSFKAKGLFLYLISKPDGWDFSFDRIVLQTSDGDKSVLSGLKELEKFGLLKRSRIRVGGIFKGVDYILSYEFSPTAENVDSVSPTAQNVDLDFVDMQNVDNNKDSLSNKDIEREEREYYYPDIIVGASLPLVPEYDAFLDHCVKSAKNIKNVLAYRVSIADALIDEKHKKHKKTLLAFEMFKTGYYSSSNVLPVGTNIFDLIGRD